MHMLQTVHISMCITHNFVHMYTFISYHLNPIGGVAGVTILISSLYVERFDEHIRKSFLFLFLLSLFRMRVRKKKNMMKHTQMNINSKFPLIHT